MSSQRVRRNLSVCLFAVVLALFTMVTQAATEHPLGDEPLTRTPLPPKDREHLLGRLAQLTIKQKQCRNFEACEDVITALLAGSVRFIEPMLRAQNPNDENLKKVVSCFNLPLFTKEISITRELDDNGHQVGAQHEASAEGPVAIYSVRSFGELLVGDGFLVMLSTYRSLHHADFEAPDLIKILDKHTCSQIGDSIDLGYDLFDVGFFAFRGKNYIYRIMKYPETVAVWIVPGLLGGGSGTALFELR